MNKKLLSILIILFVITGIRSQNIASARAAAVGSTVTIRGIVTNGSELGNIRYVQDPSAGLPAFGAGLVGVIPGDSIAVTGPTTLYFNLLEISPVNSFTVIASGKPLPAPNVITPSSFAEPVEGSLIRINNGIILATGNFAGNTNYTVSVSTQTFEIRIASTATAIVGTPIPSYPVDIIGIASQYCISPTSGCTVGYQLYPRKLSDFIPSALGIEPINKNSALVMFPNPANTTINFKLNIFEPVRSIDIWDVQGRTMFSSKENLNSADVSSFANGIYHIAVRTDKENYRSTFHIQK
jgi:hypothetical protein